MKMKVFTLLPILFLALNGQLRAEGAGDEVTLPPPDQNLWQTLIMLGIAVAFFYVIFWRPEQKRRKALEDQRTALKKGDKVVAMGIIGTVARINEQTVILKMVDGAKIEFFKSAITDIIPETDEANKKADDASEE